MQRSRKLISIVMSLIFIIQVFYTSGIGYSIDMPSVEELTDNGVTVQDQKGEVVKATKTGEPTLPYQVTPLATPTIIPLVTAVLAEPTNNVNETPVPMSTITVTPIIPTVINTSTPSIPTATHTPTFKPTATIQGTQTPMPTVEPTEDIIKDSQLSKKNIIVKYKNDKNAENAKNKL